MNHWSRGTPTCQDGSHTSEWLYRPDYLVLCCPLLAAFCFTSNTPDPLKTGLKVIRKVDCRYPRNLVYSNSPFLLHFLFVFSSETVTEQETRFFFPLVSCLLEILISCVGQGRGEWSWRAFRDTPDWEDQRRLLWSVENFLNSLTGWSNGIFKFWGLPFLCSYCTLSQQ